MDDRGGREVVGDGLVEGAFSLDIHELAAQADAEGGEVALLGESEHGEVEVLAKGVHGGGFGGLGLAVEAGVAIAAAGDDEGVEGGDHVEAEAGVVGVGEKDGHAASGEDGVGVVGGEFVGLRDSSGAPVSRERPMRGRRFAGEGAWAIGGSLGA